MLLLRRQFLLGTVLSVLLFASLVLSAKAEASMWVQTYGGPSYDFAYSVVEVPDGGYAIAGYTRSFGAGGYDAWLVKTDAFGNMEWNRAYGGSGYEGAYSLVNSPDGGYALAGYTRSFGASGSEDFWLIKTDSFGNMEWNKTYWQPSASDWAYSLVATSDGGYALAGTTDSHYTGSKDCWLVKTDSSGNMEWNKTYGGNGDDVAYSLVAASDGGYALAGQTAVTAFSADCWLIKTDSFGNVEWNQTYGTEWYAVANSLVAASDGGYVVVVGPFLVKTDASGDVEWNQTYGGFSSDPMSLLSFSSVYSLAAASDGGYALGILTGLYAFYNDIGNSNVSLVKTDAFGNMEWKQTYDGANLDIARSVVATSDGGYALAGDTGSFDAGYQDFWLIKTDEFGNVPEASWVILPLLLAATLAIFISKKKLLHKRSEERWIFV